MAISLLEKMNGTSDNRVDEQLGMATASIHAHDKDLWTWKPTILPIVTSSNFKFETLEAPKEGEGYEYTRCGNPTRKCVEQALARIEGAKYGYCFSSGMSSVLAVLHLLKPGDHIICSEIVYGGVSLYLNEFVKSWGFEVSYINADNPEDIRKAIRSNTKLLWLESLTNPTIKLVDIKAIATCISDHPEVLIVVDNTFLTPYLYKPLSQGAHIVMNSVTKFLNGHGDVLMGALATNDAEIADKLKKIQEALGIVPSTFDCYLVNRSLKTLKIRMKEHCSNAQQVAEFLEAHPAVERVIYPGLKSHCQHELAKTQLQGFGGMLGFYLKSDQKQTKDFLMKLKTCIFSASLGMAESIMCYPWTISHAMLTTEVKKAIGVTENFLRLSVGLEDVQDIIHDLEQALKVIQ